MPPRRGGKDIADDHIAQGDFPPRRYSIGARGAAVSTASGCPCGEERAPPGDIGSERNWNGWQLDDGDAASGAGYRTGDQQSPLCPHVVDSADRCLAPMRISEERRLRKRRGCPARPRAGNSPSPEQQNALVTAFRKRGRHRMHTFSACLSPSHKYLLHKGPGNPMEMRRSPLARRLASKTVLTSYRLWFVRIARRAGRPWEGSLEAALTRAGSRLQRLRYLDTRHRNENSPFGRRRGALEAGGGANRRFVDAVPE